MNLEAELHKIIKRYMSKRKQGHCMEEMRALIGRMENQKQCCVCAEKFDGREESDGGGDKGCELIDERWVCSDDCFTTAAGKLE